MLLGFSTFTVLVREPEGPAIDVISLLTGLKGKALDLRDIELLKHAYELQDENLRQLKENNDVLREAVGLAQSRVTSLEEENVDLRSQMDVLNDRLHDIEAVTPDEYSATNDNDVLAILQSWFRSRQPNENSRVIRFNDVDRELRLPPGSTKKHIQNVAQRYSYKIEHGGDDTILFTKVHDAPSVSVFDRRRDW